MSNSKHEIKEDSLLVFIGDNQPINFFQEGVLKFLITLNGEISHLQIPTHEFANELNNLIQRLSEKMQVFGHVDLQAK